VGASRAPTARVCAGSRAAPRADSPTEEVRDDPKTRTPHQISAGSGTVLDAVNCAAANGSGWTSGSG